MGLGGASLSLPDESERFRFPDRVASGKGDKEETSMRLVGGWDDGIHCVTRALGLKKLFIQDTSFTAWVYPIYLATQDGTATLC